MGNSIDSNPPAAQLHIPSAGADWLWTVFALFLVSLLFVLLWTFVTPRGQRAFHHIAIAILVVGTIGYFTMASNLGQLAIPVEFPRGDPPGITRGIFFARYIMWALSLSLIVLFVLLGTGFTLSEIFITIVFNLTWVLLLLFGAVTRSQYKWGYWVLAVFALLWVIFHIGVLATRSSFLIFRRTHLCSALWITFFWLEYPLIWAFCDGGNVISNTGEVIWYGVVDLLTMPLFLLWQLWSVRMYNYSALGFSSGKVTDFMPLAATAAAVGAGAGAGAQPTGEQRQGERGEHGEHGEQQQGEKANPPAGGGAAT